ncbi:hypothetical protein SteCoe_2270 [Stentor coeruleus]|uniref:Secreted protein n=1 Tax=Stentor coeruleus TaxID=5963 RepID=A0A1R2CZU6_9CILI|nr:hypothetical protein SteCoe_2270 [Stentor coeruleus]
MKVCIVAILMLSLASASNLKSQIGQSCASAGNIAILLFDVSPWPPVLSGGASITIEALMIKANTSVGLITYGTMNQYHSWSYEYLPVYQYFPQSSVETFQYTFEFPTTPGNFITQVIFGSADNPPTINTCWSFAYTIGT